MLPNLLRAALLAVLLIVPPLAAQTVYVVGAETWSSPRSAESLLRLAPLREAVAALQGGRHLRLVIRHPEGEQGEFWAAELHDWLVALGVPSARMDLEPDTAVTERLDLVVGP